MADQNQNQGHQPFQQNEDWQQRQQRMNRNESYGQYRENEGGFGNAGYGNHYNQGGDFQRRNQQQGVQQSRVNYMPDNDDNRHDFRSSGSQHSDTFSTDHGYMNSGSQLGQQRNQWGNQWGSHYGASFGNQNRQDQQNRYGGQSGWGSVNNISGGYDLGNNDPHHNQWQHNRNQQHNWQGQQGNNPAHIHGANYGGNTANDWNNTIRNRDDRGWWDKDRTDVSSWMSDKQELREPRGNHNYPIGGEHRGKGPRGYQRSDERIKEDVCDRLADDALLDASEIEVNVQGSEVILTGTVLSREAKRHAEDLAESISGVRNVENRIRVGRADELEGNYTTRQILRAASGNEDPSMQDRTKK